MINEKTFKTSIWRKVRQAILKFNLIEEGDKILIAVSGGKDSLSLLKIFERLVTVAPVNFSFLACFIDMQSIISKKASKILKEHFEKNNYNYHIENFNISKIVKDKEVKTACSMCAKLRRGRLYEIAENLNCNKIALGHHGDDLIETLLMNTFLTGRLGTMPAKLLSKKYTVNIIRPMAYVFEKDIVKFSNFYELPVVDGGCEMCHEVYTKRDVVKKLISDLEKKEFPNIKSTMLGALGNVDIPNLLITKQL